MNEEINQLKYQLAEKNNEIENLKRNLEDIEKSMTWKALKKFDQVINRIFPGNNRIKRVYYSLLDKGQNIINESKEEKKPERYSAQEILKRVEKIKNLKCKKVYVFGSQYETPLYNLYINQIK